MRKGVIYIAKGQKYIDEAINSIQSLKQTNEELGVTVYSDRVIQHECVDNTICIDHNHNWGLISPNMIPYERTLYLDTDTYICSNLNPLFKLLDNFDIAAAHSPQRVKDIAADESVTEEEIPESFPLYQAAVMLYKDSKEVRSFFENWNYLFNKYSNKSGYEHNQPTLRIALYQSNLDICTVTMEYNMRPPYSGFVNGEVKILHGRIPPDEVYTQKTCAAINSSNKMRVITRDDWPFDVNVTTSPSIKYRLLRSLKSYGIMVTLKKAIKNLIEHCT
jgi:hypothetical protein